MTMMFLSQQRLLLLLLTTCWMCCTSSSDENDDEIGANVEPHFDLNLENHEKMVFVGNHYENGTRIGFDDSTKVKIRYVFGTAYDDTEHTINKEEEDIPDRQRTREEILREQRHGKVSTEPKPFGHVDIHELDGGVTPTKVVSVEPFFLDTMLVTNKEFGKFVKSTFYETEAQTFGWSFVLESFVSQNDDESSKQQQVDPEAQHWVAVDGAYWRRPEGPNSSYKYREHHPVVHVSHRDAAEYCKWLGKRLPGEREWEAAARSLASQERNMYTWGNSTAEAHKHANLWGNGKFPFENLAEDGWRGTSPVGTYPPNGLGFHDMLGNVWEWQRGGKHKARIVRGGSYVDTVNGTHNHAATLGARATLHGTTTAGNVGFRCAKPPRRRVEHHFVYHDEETHGELGVQDQFGKRDMIPQQGWEDQFMVHDDDDEFDDAYKETRKKRKVIKPRTIVSSEL